MTPNTNYPIFGNSFYGSLFPTRGIIKNIKASQSINDAVYIQWEKESDLNTSVSVFIDGIYYGNGQTSITVPSVACDIDFLIDHINVDNSDCDYFIKSISTGKRIKLSWTNPSETIRSIQIFSDNGNNLLPENDFILIDTIGANNSNWYSDILDEGTYRHFIKTIDNVGNESEKSSIITTTINTRPLSGDSITVTQTTPYYVTITINNSEIDNNREGYSIYSNYTGTTLENEIDWLNPFMYTKNNEVIDIPTKLIDGIYKFAVKAIDKYFVESETVLLSQVIISNGIIFDEPITPPVLSGIPIQDGKIYLSWDAVSGDNFSSYQIDYSTDLITWNSLINITDINTAAYLSDTLTTSETLYYFRLGVISNPLSQAVYSDYITVLIDGQKPSVVTTLTGEVTY